MSSGRSPRDTFGHKSNFHCHPEIESRPLNNAVLLFPFRLESGNVATYSVLVFAESTYQWIQNGRRMRRRALLAGLASSGVVSAAGCVNSLSSESAPTKETVTRGTRTNTETEAPRGSTEPASVGEQVTVGETTLRTSGPTVQESYFHRTSADSWGVTGAEGRFCFVGVAIASGPNLPVDAFSLVAGGESIPLRPSVADADPMVLSGPVSAGQAYDGESMWGWVGADVPHSIEFEEPLLRIDTGDAVRTLSIPTEPTQALGREPGNVSIESVQAPESVASDGSIELSVTVTNDGAGPATARVVVNESGPSYQPHRFRESISGGASAVRTMRFKARPQSDHETPHRYVVIGADAKIQRSVTVPASSG
jgi:hypothetical protein